MNMTIDQQLAFDEAPVPHASRLRIKNSNFHLKLDISSKESTHQLAEMLHICLRLPGHTFDELLFEEEILAFLGFLGHSGEIRRLTDDPSIPRRNKVNWHYVRDDQMFTMIKLVSRHQNTQQFGAMLPIELTNEDIRNSEAYKECYTVATGAAPPKTQASVREAKSSSDTTVTPPTAAAGTRLSSSAKGKQPTKASKTKSLTVLSEVAMTEAEHLKLAMKRSLQQTHISQASGYGAYDGTEDDNDVDEGSDDQDDDDQDDENQDDDDQDEGDDDDDQDKDEESFDPIAKMPEKTDDECNDEENLGLNVGREEGQDEDELYRDANINLEERVVQMADFAGAVSSILRIVQRYMDQRMNKAIKVAIQIQSDRLRDEAQAENEEFLKNLDENIQKIIKEQVKEQVKTTYAVAADLSEIELKKILIKKMEGNKSIHRYDEQRNLYKALVKAYESDKIILDTYRDTVTLKRRCDDDADKDEEPSIGSDRGSKRRREGKEPESTSALKEKATRTTCKCTQGSKYRQTSTSDLYDKSTQSRHLDSRTAAGPTYELMMGSCKSLVELEFFLEEVYKATTNQLDWINPEGHQYPHTILKPLPLIPKSRGRRVISFDHFINNDLEYLHGGSSSRKYTTSVTKTKAADYGHIKWIEDLVPRTMWIQELVGYDKHALWGISHWGRKRQTFT
nr:hypothetical protein [Tanacetum cinerariifolium]